MTQRLFQSPVGSICDREELPQIDDVVDFVDFIRGMGHNVAGPAPYLTSSIHPTQRSINIDKVKEILSNMNEDRPLVVSREFRLLDGHHYLYSAKIRNQLSVTCYVVFCDIEDLVNLGFMYNSLK